MAGGLRQQKHKKLRRVAQEITRENISQSYIPDKEMEELGGCGTVRVRIGTPIYPTPFSFRTHWREQTMADKTLVARDCNVVAQERIWEEAVHREANAAKQWYLQVLCTHRVSQIGRLFFLVCDIFS